jgi:two-component system LytT family sensor kinase
MILQVSMGGNFLSINVTIMFAGLNMILAMTVFYLNGLWIFPMFFNNNRYGLFLLLNLAVHIILSLLFLKVDGLIVAEFLTTEMQEQLPSMSPNLRIFSLLVFAFVISLVFSLLRKVEIQDITEKKLSKEKMNTEIQLLKAHINPHFIFNSMNNIYSMAYSKSDQTPDAVLKLSAMLRYVYYDCNRDEVSLGAEVKYIQNYIAFQQMKSPHEQSIILELTGIDESFRIAPMLFIPFVENSFKYSKIEDIQDANVKIKLTTQGNNLCFIISNTHPENGKSSGSGLGIENVRNRLALTYPGKYELEIKDQKNTFEVIMKIERS